MNAIFLSQKMFHGKSFDLKRAFEKCSYEAI